MAGFPRLRFLAIAVVFHFVYIFSIFDIYFVSPVVSGMRLFQVERPAEVKAPADRLVLLVGRFHVHLGDFDTLGDYSKYTANHPV